MRETTDRNITLIGMPGSGKTTLGRILAARLNYRFIDADDLIKRSGRSLQQIIDQDGEEEFLRIEGEILSGLQGEKMVMAPGGSCVMSHVAMQHLRNISFVMFIDVPLHILALRLVNVQERGIVGLRDHSLEELSMIRRPLYEWYAHATAFFPDQDSDPEISASLLEKIFKNSTEEGHG